MKNPLPDLTPFVNTITNHVLAVLRQEQQEPVLFITGEVISTSPLQIKIDDRNILQEDSLLLSATVKETWIDIPTTTGAEAGEDNGTDNVFMHRHHIVGETQETNDGGQGASNHKHTIDIYTKYALPKIRLWRGLVEGDIVRLLKVQGGQFYFVLEREEMITNETPEETGHSDG